MDKQIGFTILEIALVLIILALAFGVITPVYNNFVVQANTENVLDELKEISDAIDEYFLDNGVYPDSLSDIFNPVPTDPWGNEYQYLKIKDTPPSGLGDMRKDKNLVPINSDYDLYSVGPDGKTTAPLTAKSSRDDIVRGRNGSFYGVATDY